MTELKRRPFCGGEAEIVKRRDLNTGNEFYKVRCAEFCSIFPTSAEREDLKHAIEIWNTRKPIDEVVERLGKLKGICRDSLEIKALEEAIEIVKGGAA